jgi:O-antigen/teichoic acid export membrane protein
MFGDSVFLARRLPFKRRLIYLIRQRILRAAISTGAVRIISLSISLFLTPFMLHRLGGTQYGLFILISSLATQGALLDFGIAPAVVKFVAETHAQRDYVRGRGIIATAMSLYCLLALAVLLIAAALAALFPHVFSVPTPYRTTAIIAVFLMGVQVAVSIPMAISGAILWGLQRYEQSEAIGIFATVLAAASTVVVLLAGGDIVALIAAGTFAALIPQTFSIWLAHRSAPELKIGWKGARRDLIGKLFSSSISSFLIQFSSNLQTQIDEIVIGIFLPISSVGGYYVARRLSALPQMLSQPILGAFIPLASQLHAQNDINRLRELYLIGSRAILAICTPLLVVVVALAGPLLRLWVGTEYATSGAIVVILALASVLEVGYWPGRMIMQGIGRHHGLARATICAAIANLGLSVFLIRYFGVMGVALGTLIPAIFVNVGYIWPYTMRTVGISGLQLFKEALVPAFVPALPMMAALYILIRTIEPTGLILVGVTAAAGVATYAVFYLVFFAGEQEQQFVKAITRRMLKTSSKRPKTP